MMYLVTSVLPISVPSGLPINSHRSTDILDGKIKTLDANVEMSGRYSLTMSMCYELRERAQTSKAGTQKYIENFLRFMMDNFDAELTVMGAQTAIVRYGINVKPKELPSFNEFHERFGKYIRKARSMDEK